MRWSSIPLYTAASAFSPKMASASYFGKTREIVPAQGKPMKVCVATTASVPVGAVLGRRLTPWPQAA